MARCQGPAMGSGAGAARETGRLPTLPRVGERRRVWLVLLLVVAACSSGGDDDVAEPADEPDQIAAYVPQFEEVDCPSEMTDARIECGELLVPADRSAPDDGSVRLPVAIVRAAGGARANDPVV